VRKEGGEPVLGGREDSRRQRAASVAALLGLSEIERWGKRRGCGL